MTSDFFNFSLGELEVFLKEELDLPAYRAGQLFEWVYGKGVRDFAEMSNIGKELREKLAGVFTFPKAAVAERQVSVDGSRKYLLEMEGGDKVEAVMIKQPDRMTLCVSSQVGCAMGCGFCRTATMGLKRHLSTSEIIRQVLAVIEDAKQFDDMFSNVVFMGMGEPLHNVKGVIGAVRILTAQKGLSIAPRKITVSTSGLVPSIKKFGEALTKASLAVSLNATTNEIRSKIMPVNKAYPIEKLLDCLREYPVGTRQKITIEYVLLAGVNDSPEDMRRLPKLLHGIRSKINLIPYNENAALGFRAPQKENILTWQKYLHGAGFESSIRWSKGADISAACGQLATATVQKSRELPVLTVVNDYVVVDQ